MISASPEAQESRRHAIPQRAARPAPRDPIPAATIRRARAAHPAIAAIAAIAAAAIDADATSAASVIFVFVAYVVIVVWGLVLAVDEERADIIRTGGTKGLTRREGVRKVRSAVETRWSEEDLS